jgi:phenylacetate-CoA ligase
MSRQFVELLRQRADLRLDPAGLQRLTDARVAAVVGHAYERVPYYRKLMDAAGVDPASIRSVDDLARIPISTKSDLREAGTANIVSRDVDLASCEVVYTSGSTGEPFGSMFLPEEVRMRRAAQLRTLLSVGLKPLDRLAVLGPVRWYAPGPVQRLGMFRRTNISQMTSFEEQVARLRDFRPTILWAYPGALHALLDHIDFDLDAVCRPRMLITSAENTDRLFAAAGNRLPSERVNLYGCIEVGRIAWECDRHAGLHINADQVWLEVVPSLDSPESGTGEVVVTSLMNRTMPLIRYRLRDVASRLDRLCACGSPLPLMSAPRGRLYEPLRLPSGATRSTLGFMFLLRVLPWVIRFRVVQKALDRVEVQLVTRDEIAEAEAEILKRKISAYLGESVRVEIRRVAALEDDPLKSEFFVSEL